MTHIKTMLLSAITISMISGCGSNSSIQTQRDNLIEPKVPQANKIVRANWDGVAPIEQGFFITNDASLLSFKIKDDHIREHNYQTEAIFIDSDNDAQTGYRNANWGNVGAEYLLQGGRLFRYGGEGWSWDFVANISSHSVAEDELEDEFSMGLIPNLSEHIHAVASLLDNDWHIIVSSQILDYQIENMGDGNIIPSQFTLQDTTEAIQAHLQNDFIGSEDFNTEVLFIDADNNDQTGYRNPQWNNIGAEYLISQGALYHYNGTGWSWSFVRNVDRVQNDAQVDITLQKEGLELSNQVRIIAGLLNQNWETTIRYEITPLSIEVDDNNGGGEGNNGGETLEHITIEDLPTRMNLTMTSTNVENAQTEAIFIDTDNNPQTGYSNDVWQYGAMGAEYLIQGGQLYRYNGTGWSWTQIDRVDLQVDGNSMSVSIPKTNMQLAQTITIFPTLLNQDWALLERFAAEDIQPTHPASGELSVRHDLNFFWFTLLSQDISIDDSMQVEFYIDEDDNPNTGFSVNGAGAETRIINNIASVFQGGDTWGDLHNGESNEVAFVHDAHRVDVRTRRSQLPYTHRHIAVTARVLDANGNEIATIAPFHYVVQADNDEITLNLDDPEYYTFEFHSSMIQEEHFGHDAVDDLVYSLHLAIDLDNNHFTGNQMNGVGADYFTHSVSSHRELYVFVGTEGTHSWWERWDEVEDSDTIVSVQDGLVTIAIPRTALPIDGPFTVASTLNDKHGHFYWTNHYEFDLGN